MQTAIIKWGGGGETHKLKTLYCSRGLNTPFYFLLCLLLKHSWPTQCFYRSYQIELNNREIKYWERERPGGKKKNPNPKTKQCLKRLLASL